jgi:hypothetical protein
MATDWVILDVTSALKSDDTPRADESYRYGEAGLSQQVCAVLSEISSRVSCWNVEGAYSNLSCSYGGGTPKISETHPAIAHRINTVTILFYSMLFGTVTAQNRGLKFALINTRVATVDYSGILHKSHTNLSLQYDSFYIYHAFVQ